MRKFISALVLITFAFVTQVPFIHALDMNMDHNMVISDIKGVIIAENMDVCSEESMTPTKSCLQEVPESKWIQNVKKSELIPLVFAVLLVFFTVAVFNVFSSSFTEFYKRRTLYQGTLYLGLYGIIRNVN